MYIGLYSTSIVLIFFCFVDINNKIMTLDLFTTYTKLFCNYLKSNLPYIQLLFIISLMVVPASIINTKIFLISLFTITTLELKLLQIFLPQVMANHHELEWVEQLKGSCPRKV